jgi:hypothetical protein
MIWERAEYSSHFKFAAILGMEWYYIYVELYIYMYIIVGCWSHLITYYLGSWLWSAFLRITLRKLHILPQELCWSQLMILTSISLQLYPFHTVHLPYFTTFYFQNYVTLLLDMHYMIYDLGPIWGCFCTTNFEFFVFLDRFMDWCQKWIF